MDPADCSRDMKRKKDYSNKLGYVADAHYGIPTCCSCGGRIIDEVLGKEDFDTLPGKRFFTCQYYQDDGMHFRQPWVMGVQEELQKLTKRVDEAEQLIWGVQHLNKRIDTLQEQVQILLGQVADLEKICFE